MKKVKLGKFSFADSAWSNISDLCKDFISQLLTKDQDKRPNAEQALKHEWITSLNQQTVDTQLAVESLGNL